jgi:hypothetical protein
MVPALGSEAHVSALLIVANARHAYARAAQR